MKRINLMLGLVLLLAQWGMAQKFTKTFSSNGTIEIVVNSSDIHIEAHNSNEVVIETSDFEPPPERAKGLRATTLLSETELGRFLREADSESDIIREEVFLDKAEDLGQGEVSSTSASSLDRNNRKAKGWPL